MYRNKAFFILLIVMFVSACAEQPKKSVVLVPVEERNAPAEPIQTDVVEIEPTNNIENNSVEKKTTPVIVALIDEARGQAKTGDAARAAATIERGLRIEPKNALLWNQLAKIRLQQQQWQQAIVLARKSNALAAYDAALKSSNWGVMATAYEALGKTEKAKEARKKQRAQG